MTIVKPFFNPAVSVFPLDTDAQQEMAMCEVRQGDATSRYAIPAVLVDFLKSFNGVRETEEAITAYQQLHPGLYSTAKLQGLVKNFLLPKGLLVDPENQSLPPQTVSRPSSFLYLRVRLVPAQLVNSIAPLVSWLFNRWIFIAGWTVIVAVHVIFYAKILPNHPFNLNTLTAPQVIFIMLLATIPAFIHEWGHASAFAYYGCRNAEIGWGLYVYFFVFYTDVSEAWKLNRKQRAMMDIAGIYFQSLSLVVLLLLFWRLKSPVLLYCFFMVDLSIAGSLNPFLRMDGYWLMADLFGIVNLRKQSLALMKSGLLKLGRPIIGAQTAPVLNLSRTASIALIAYVLLGSVFFLYLYKIMLYQVIYSLGPAYPHVWVAFWRALSERPIGVLQILSSFLEVLWRSMVLLGLSIFVFRTLLLMWKYLQIGLRFLTTRLIGRPSRGEENFA
jgi:putative peptide zinc metalloprotease protein